MISGESPFEYKQSIGKFGAECIWKTRVVIPATQLVTKFEENMTIFPACLLSITHLYHFDIKLVLCRTIVSFALSVSVFVTSLFDVSRSC